MTQHNTRFDQDLSFRTSDGEQFTVTQFETSPFMSSYLVAFIVSDYTTLASDQDRVRVYAPVSNY